ncbi:hypothetical protein BJ963_001719 [Leifsonia soli]|uniref:Uncharacterized protein n=1 Tax=Leifsonia soli TaxID=582665 RepID=A0A852T0M6_9MICO|nr:hypothetical protein [Leifsonia soli]
MFKWGSLSSNGNFQPNSDSKESDLVLLHLKHAITTFSQQ